MFNLFIIDYIANMQVALGIDIGGTNVKFGLMTPRGQILQQDAVKTREFPHVGALAKHIKEMCAAWLRGADLTLMGVGVGAANARKSGDIVGSPHLSHWGDTNLAQIFTDIFKLPTKVINDATAMALAEKNFGVASHMQNFCVLTLGTGLGSGFFTEGRLLLGQEGLAGETGHMVIHPQGRLCACGGLGHLEAYVSSYGILQTAHDLMGQDSVRDVKAVFSLAKGGDGKARAVIAETCQHLALACAAILSLFCPEAIIFSGQISPALAHYLSHIKELAEAQVLASLRDKTAFLLSGVDAREGSLKGAASLFQMR